MRIKSPAFDVEITALINDCLSELKMLGIYTEALRNDPQILTTVIFYVKGRFGAGVETEKWEKLYRDKLVKLMIAKDYGGRANNAEE